MLIPKPGVCWGSASALCLTLQHMVGLCPLWRLLGYTQCPAAFSAQVGNTGLPKDCTAQGASWNPWEQCGPLTRANKTPLVPIRPAPQTAWGQGVVLQGAVLASWRSPGAEAQPSDIILGFWDAPLESRGPGRNKPHSTL